MGLSFSFLGSFWGIDVDERRRTTQSPSGPGISTMSAPSPFPVRETVHGHRLPCSFAFMTWFSANDYICLCFDDEAGGNYRRDFEDRHGPASRCDRRPGTYEAVPAVEAIADRLRERSGNGAQGGCGCRMTTFSAGRCRAYELRASIVRSRRRDERGPPSRHDLNGNAASQPCSTSRAIPKRTGHKQHVGSRHNARVSPTYRSWVPPLTHGDFVIAIQHMFNLPRTDEAIDFAR